MVKVSFFETNHILTCNSINWVNFVINNKTFEWLLDTGASLSAVKKSFFETNSFYYKIIKDELLINGVGGKLRAIGYVYLKLQTERCSFVHKFYVFEDLPCKSVGILGQDFLQKYAGIIDFSKNKLSLKECEGKEISIPLQFYNYSITIAPRCEVIKYFPVNRTEDCVVFRKELQKGVFLANGIATPRNGMIPIRILNTTSDIVVCNLTGLEINPLTNYNYCFFAETDRSVQRVKEIFSLLKLDYLNNEERLSIEQICAKYPDIFHLPRDKLTVTNVYEQSIRLKDNVTPVYRKPYRIPFVQKKEVDRQVQEMLNNNIIEKSVSEWSSPVLIVPKKADRNGEKKWRVVVDYRQLNERIQDDKFPLPNINEILDSLSGAMYFSHCDLSQSYYQCKLNEQSRKFTAFTTDKGQFQMRRLPMGLKISPSAFSRMMTVAMSGLNYDKCLIYLDDLIIFGRNLDEHNRNLISIFSRLRNVNLKLNPSKCEFLKKQILYLGHIISSEGLSPDPEKVAVIKNYPRPSSSDEVKRFVAFANYYRKFIPNFANIVIPMNKLCKQNVVFDWTDDCEKSFLLLKDALVSPPILDFPDFSDSNTFILQTDSSGFAVGSVLCNGNGKPVAYASRSLGKSELNYPIIEKELLAIVWSVKYFRPYLYGRKFIVKTDHRPLLYLFNMSDPSSRLTKFRLCLEEYDFQVEYIKGKDNVLADALSRIVISSDDLKTMHEKTISVMTRAQCRLQSENSVIREKDSTVCRNGQPRIVEVLKKQGSDIELIQSGFDEWEKLLRNKKCTKIFSKSRKLMYMPENSSIYINYDSLSTSSRDELSKEIVMFCIEKGIKEVIILKNRYNANIIMRIAKFLKKNSSSLYGDFKVCVVTGAQRVEDKDEKKVIMNDFHILPTSGHAGIRRMVSNIKKYYYWPSIERDVVEYVRKCSKCQKQKFHRNTKEPMTVTTTASSSFEKIYLDIVGPLDRDDYGNVYILTLQCELTKFVEAYPIKNKSANEVAKALAENFILRFGIPQCIATDRGSEFISKVMVELCNILGISKTLSTAYHHESIGSLENVHKTLGAYLRIQTNNNSSSWSSWIPYWCFSYNTTVHTVTKYTPYELVFGKTCRLPSNLINGTVEPLYNFDDYPLEFKYRLQRAQADAKKNLIDCKIARKELYDKNIYPVTYNEGDLILVRNETGSKLDCVYEGPFVVIKDESPNVKIIRKNKIDVIHKNRTKLYCDS